MSWVLQVFGYKPMYCTKSNVDLLGALYRKIRLSPQSLAVILLKCQFKQFNENPSGSCWDISALTKVSDWQANIAIPCARQLKTQQNQHSLKFEIFSQLWFHPKCTEHGL